VLPQVLVEAQTADGSAPHSIILQNAETVKLVGAANPGTGISVASLQPGDQVLIHRPAVAARHTGIAVDEWLVEQ
jgi:3-dehydroquinate synthase class II